MLAAVIAVVFGAGMFGASFIMFVTVLEDIRINKVPQGMDVIKQFLIKEKARLMSPNEKK